jgi:hypothetical protein
VRGIWLAPETSSQWWLHSWKSVCGWGFLEIAGADFGRRNLRGDGEHGHARPVTVEQAVDQMQVARAAAPRAYGEFTRQMRLGGRRESGNLLVPDMHPLDLALSANCVGQAVQAVADNAVYSLDAH